MFFKKKTSKKNYDPHTQKPVLHCSICTGEQVAGFKYLFIGKFEDIMLIRNDADLQQFMTEYGITDSSVITKEY